MRQISINYIKPFRCVAHGEKNADLSLEIEVKNDWKFIDDENERKLENGDIIKAPLPGSADEQLFRIYETDTSSSSYATTYKARHIFYDLGDNFILDTRPTNASPREALQKLLSNTQFATNFTIGEVFEGARATAYWQFKSPIDALIGNEDNSFINRWGGELHRDNFKISFIKPENEIDEIMLVRFGHNLQELGLTISNEDIVTRIMPTALTEQNEIIKLPELYIDSDNIANYDNPKIKRYHYSDIRRGGEGFANDEQIYAELRKRAKEEFAKGIDLPKIIGKVSIVDLSQTVEYAGATMYEVKPYDSFTIIDREGNKYATSLTSFDYDCLAKRYINLGFGDVGTLANFQKLIKAINA